MTYIAHGTDPNEIGHGVDIDLNDTPGSTGGKFIGFGEPGTSAKANRAHWFLSQNIDHVYQEVHREIAVPKGYDRTSPGGGESTFQFPTGEEIWMGDDSYPGSAGSSDLEGMHMLFDVLDSNYNELTDGADNEIRVKLVRESTNTTDMYQGGSPFVDSFQDQPIIHFIAVDPATGATVTDPYTIPAATNYKVQCGVKSTIAELPADALVRYKVQGASEVEAGMLLQDGTRPMTGNLDLDGNNLINADVVSNVTGEPLDISSDHNLLFKDQYLSAGLALSESGQTALYQPVAALIHPSLVGAVNSNAEARELMSGNRTMDQTGSVSPSNAVVTYPDLKVMLQGQVVTIAGDTITAPDVTDTYYLCVTSAGVVVLLDDSDWGGSGATDPAAGSVLIWKGDYTSTGAGTGTWANPVDLRWPSTRRGNHMAVYVGDGVGADFASLNEAIIWITEAALIESSKISITYEIVIVGSVEVSSTITLPDGWVLRGLGNQGADHIIDTSVIYTTRDFPVDSHVVVAGSNSIIKNLKIMWYNWTASQNSDKAALSIGAGAVVENVRFYRNGTYVFGMNIHIAAAALVTTSDTIIRNCSFDRFAMAGVWAEGKARVRIENSKFSCNAGTPSYHINLAPTNATGDATSPAHIISGCYFEYRPSVANIQIGGSNVLIDSCHGSLATGSNTPFIKIISAGSTQDRAGATIRNCLVESGFQFVSCAIDNSGLQLNVAIEGCVGSFSGTNADVLNFACVNVSPSSCIVVRDCSLTLGGSSTGYIGHFEDVQSVKFVHNSVQSADKGIIVTGATIAVLDGNDMQWSEGYCVEFAGYSHKSRLINNKIAYIGTTVGTVGIRVFSEHIIIANNDIMGGTGAEIAIHVISRWNRISNNRLSLWSLYFIHINPGVLTGDRQWITDNYFEYGCTKTDTITLTDVVASAIYISGGNAAENLVITGNIFFGQYGSAIRCKDGLSDGTVVSDNIFDSVQGRHLLSGPSLSKYSVIALEAGGGWTISNNTFRNCGHATALTFSGATTLLMSAIYLANTRKVTISNNSFGDSVANGSNVENLTEEWADIRSVSAGDVVCSGNTFYKDLTLSVPKSSFSQIYKDAGASALVITGCSFTITGEHATYLTAVVHSVHCNAAGAVTVASGCHTFGDFVCGTLSNDFLWYITGGYGSIMGNYFDGAHQVNLYVNGGFTMGNMHVNKTIPVTAWTLGEEPAGSLATYNKEYDVLP